MLKMQPAIVILGAGAAGLAAATKLIANGFVNVTVLEAENRIGGRIVSVPFGNTIIDLGAQWIHGEKDNIVYNMVKSLDVVSHTKSSNYDDLTFFASNNSKINKNLIDRLKDIADEIFEDEAAAAEHGGSLGMYFKERFSNAVNRHFGDDNEEVLKVAKTIEEWFSKFILCYDAAASWEQIASSRLSAYEKCEGDPLINWRNNGYSTILDLLIGTTNLAKEDFLKTNVQLNKEVSKISWNHDTDDATKKVNINCTDGSTYLADHVIVTFSVAVLKSNLEVLFEPSLPDYKVNCIEHIPLGASHKIFLKFAKKWWPDDLKDFSFLWLEEDKRKLLTEFPEGPVHEGRSWLEDLFGFYTIDNDPNILLGWFVGPMTKEVELLPDHLVQKASMFLLRKFLGQTYGDIPEPESIIRSKWKTNPHFLGTYSYFGIEAEKRGATHEDLAKPLIVDDKEVVLFAGEATHSKYFSTVHGAIETGYREASRLIGKYK